MKKMNVIQAWQRLMFLNGQQFSEIDCLLWTDGGALARLPANLPQVPPTGPAKDPPGVNTAIEDLGDNLVFPDVISKNDEAFEITFFAKSILGLLILESPP